MSPLCSPPIQAIQRFLEEHPIFSALSPEERAWLASRVGFFEIPAGDALIEQGERSTGMFLLLEGRAGVSRDHEGMLLPIATLQTGDVCAEISVFSSGPAIATARASIRCVAIRIAPQDFAALAARRPAIAERLRSIACRRIEEVGALAEETASCREGRTALV